MMPRVRHSASACRGLRPLKARPSVDVKTKTTRPADTRRVEHLRCPSKREIHRNGDTNECRSEKQEDRESAACRPRDPSSRAGRRGALHRSPRGSVVDRRDDRHPLTTEMIMRTARECLKALVGRGRGAVPRCSDRKSCAFIAHHRGWSPLPIHLTKATVCCCSGIQKR